MSGSSGVDRQAEHWARWAQHYDDDSQGYLDPSQAIDALAELAGEGPVFELGIGTGRLALPLAQRGIPVRGIDASPQMLAQLYERRGCLPVDAELGDMANFQVPEPVKLVYAAASTFFLLTSQQAQVACFRSAAMALSLGGRLVIEAGLPSTVIADQVCVRHIDDDHVRLSAQVHDPVTQQVMSQEIRLQADGRWRMLPTLRRYASPAELDLVAQLAGLCLDRRYGGWDWSPFTGGSTRHVSVYEQAESPNR